MQFRFRIWFRVIGLLEPYSLSVYQARREHLDWLPEEESPPEESETQTLTTGC